MGWLAEAIIAGITSFVATNIDDIVILMLFFSQVNSQFRPRHIILGQYLGFTALILLSLPGFFGGLVVPRAWIGLLGFVPIGIGIHHLIHPETDDEIVQTVSPEMNAASPSIFRKLLTAETLNVAAVTLANGGDNIGIYLPLFASSTLASFAIILATFFLLIGVWCYAAYQFTRQPTMARYLTHATKALVPFVLIGLGLFILIESGTYKWVPLFSSHV